MTSVSTPAILLAFANDRDDRARYLRNLAEEARQVQRALAAAEGRGHCELVLRQNVTAADILDVFQDARYRDRIAIFHFGGHADGYRLLLETAAGSPAAANAGGLARFLAPQRGLELVFLNGCSTEGQVLDLLAAGVSAVIATDQAVDDAAATGFAVRFYQGLAGGASIAAAFEQARAALDMQGGRIFRDIGAAEEVQKSGVPWRLHIRHGAETVADWSLPQAVGDPLFGLPALPPLDMPDKPYRYLHHYRREDAWVFFGRDREIRALYDRVTAMDGPPIVLLYGQSGVGKSSLLAAGLLPRLEDSHEVRYARRDQAQGLLGTLAAALKSAPEADLAAAWRAAETAAGRPLLVILDQVEELFTRPNSQRPDEMAPFLAALASLFGDPGRRPAGRLILGFRKEWLAEIKERLSERTLPCSEVFLERLGREGIIEIVTGPGRTPRLRDQYRLTVGDPLLPGQIADDLLADRESPVAPLLAILLAGMWEAARARSYDQPVFDENLYHEFRSRGLKLDDFLGRQLKALGNALPEVVDSGLALDVLAYHTTPLGTAEQRTLADLEQTYSHRRDVLPGLVQQCQDLYLLVDPARNQPGQPPASRLTHDTLAPHVRKRFDESDAPGQRARRILEGRLPATRESETPDDHQGLAPLGDADLDVVLAGQPGTRAWKAQEQQLVAVSSADRQRRLEEKTHAAQEREQARQRELEQAQKLADEQRLRAEEGEQAARGLRTRFRFALAAAAIALILLGVAGLAVRQASMAQGLAKTEQERAEREAMEAERQRGSAVAAQATAEVNAAEAERQRNLAEQRQLEAEARSLAAQAERLRESDLALSLLLASEAAQMALRADKTPPVEIVSTLYRLLAAPHTQLLRDIKAHNAHTWAVALWPDETKFVTAGCDQRLSSGVCQAGQARVWSSNGALLAEFANRPTDLSLVVISPDGERILTADDKGGVQLWAAGDLREIATLEGYTGTLSSAAFSPDGQRILTVGEREPARLWNAEGRLLALLDAEAERTYSATFSQDGQRIATSHCTSLGDNDICSSGYARLWDDDGQPVTLFAQGAGVRWVSFGPGNAMVSAECAELANSRCVTDMVRVWDPAGQLLAVLEGRRFLNPLRHVEFDASGARILAYSATEAALWTGAGELLVKLDAPTNHLWTVRFSPDGQLVIVTSSGPDPGRFNLYKTQVRLWDKDGRFLADLPARHEGYVKATAMTADHGLLLTAGLDGLVQIWDTSSAAGTLSGQLTGHSGFLLSASYSPDGSRLATVADDGVRLWDANRNLLAHLEARAAQVYTARFSRQGDLLATLACDVLTQNNDCARGALRLWNAAGTPVRQVAGYRFAGGFDFAPDGSRMATASEGNTAQLLDASGQRIALLTGHTGPVNRIAYSPDGARIGTSSDDGTVRVWDANGQPLIVLSGHTGPTRGVQFGAAAAAILTYSDDGSIRLWNDRGQLLHVLDGHSGGVKFATFNRTGTLILAESNQGPARLWDSDGELVAVLGENATSVDVAAFDPAGQRIMTVECNVVNEGDWCVRHSVNLWDTHGKLIATVGDHWVEWAAFRPDGRQIITAGCDMFQPPTNTTCLAGGVWVWQDYPNIDALLAEAAMRAGRSLTAAECQQYLGQEQCP